MRFLVRFFKQIFWSQVAKKTLNPAVIGRSRRTLIAATNIASKWRRLGAHFQTQLRQLKGLYEASHPATDLTLHLMRRHPNVRRAIIDNLVINATWRGRENRQEFARRHGVVPPYLMVISPTMRCNLHCRGCYAAEYPKGPDPLSFDDLDRLVSEGKEMGVFMYTISGGEPFVRSDLLDLYAKHRDAFFLIYTNGTTIGEREIEAMQTLGNFTPAISIEGDEAMTDWRRGPGVYRKTKETMARLNEAGLLFGFSATAMRTNAEYFLHDDFVDEMIQRGCLYGWFFIFVPVGKDNTVELMITPEQRDRLRHFNTIYLRRTKPIFVADFWNDGHLTRGCMAGGELYLHVNFRGDLEPCVFIHFAKDNIKDIWANGGHLWDVLSSPFFREIRAHNRRDPNLLRPCIIIDHNEWLEHCVRTCGAHPTHEGAEAVIEEPLCHQIRQLAGVYAPLADQALVTNRDYYRNFEGDDSPVSGSIR